MIHTHIEKGLFRLWFRGLSLLEVGHTFGLALSIELPSDWHEDGRGLIHIHLIWPDIYIGFPWYRTYEDHYQCQGPKLGFNFFQDLLFLYHGNSTGKQGDRSSTAIRMPWGWNHVRHSVLNSDGEMVDFVGEWEDKKVPDGRVSETHKYSYTMRNGTVQERAATIFVEEREWRRMFWFPRKMIRRGIDISFSDEVGERTGSWKGGTLGCGYDLLPDETPLECLRRMERERKF